MISQSCNACATTKCIQTSSSGDGKKSGSHAGGIAGGVVGGIAFIALLIFLVWWFFIRKKRQDMDQEMNEVREKFSPTGSTTATPSPDDDAQSHAMSMASEGGQSSASPHTRRSTSHSIASTTGTRASNVIQIAYIPGVTNRSLPADTPPVPPLPEQHFFIPADLRSRSSWATTAGGSSRSSWATTVFHNNAIVDPLPAQQATLTRAAVVSIHNRAPSRAASVRVTPADAPAVPSITDSQLTRADMSSEINSVPLVARTCVAKPVTVTRSPSKATQKGDLKGDSEGNGQSSEDKLPQTTTEEPAQNPFKDQDGTEESPFSDSNELK